MGGIACRAQHGFIVRLYDIKEDHKSWKDKYRQKPRKRKIRGKVTEKEKIQCLNNLVFTTSLERLQKVI